MKDDSFHKTVSVYPEPINQIGSQISDLSSGHLETTLPSPGGELRLHAFHGENSTSHLISCPSDGCHAVVPSLESLAPTCPASPTHSPHTDLLAGPTIAPAKPAAPLCCQSFDQASNMTLDDMLATATRIRNEVQATSPDSESTGAAVAWVTAQNPSPQRQTALAAPGDAPGPLKRASADSLRLVSNASSNSLGEGAGPVAVRPSTKGSRIPGPPQTQQSRGPLEALRDELFGGSPKPSPKPSPPYSPSSGMQPMPMPAMVPEPAPSRAPPVPPLALGMLPLPAALPAPLQPAAPQAMSVTTGSYSQYSGTAGLNSPTPSTAATHNEHDLASIYSIPESGLNAAAHTPLSITTAAVSELDTPSSARSRDEDYDKSFPSPRSGGPAPGVAVGGGGGGGLSSARFSGATPGSSGGLLRRGASAYDISSGYDDYVVPSAWTSLRERHSGSKVEPPSSQQHQQQGAAGTPAGGLLERYNSAGGMMGGGLTADPSTAAVTTVPLSSAASVDLVPDFPSAPPSAPPASPTFASVSELPAARSHEPSALLSMAPDPRQPLVVRLPPLLLSFDSVGGGTTAAASTPSGGLPTLGGGLGSLLGPTCREQSNSGQLYNSLSFGVPSGAASHLDSGVLSRIGGLIAVGDGGSRVWDSGRNSHQPSTGPPTLGDESAANGGGTRSQSRTSCDSVGEVNDPVTPPIEAAAMGEVLPRASRQTGSDGSGSVGGEGYPEHVAMPGLGDLTWVNPLFAPDGISGDGGSGGRRLDSSGSLGSSPEHSPRRAVEAKSTLAPPGSEASAGVVGLQMVGMEAGEGAAQAGGAGGPHGRPVEGCEATGSGQRPEWTTETKVGLGAAFLFAAAPEGLGDGPPGGGIAGNAMGPARPTAAASTTSLQPPVLPPSAGPTPRASPLPPLPPPSSLGSTSSPSSGMSRAVVGAVPLQNREERVRSWAEDGADFAAAPPSCGSHGGLHSSLAATPESSWFGPPVSEASIPPSPRPAAPGPQVLGAAGGGVARADAGPDHTIAPRSYSAMKQQGPAESSAASRQVEPAPTAMAAAAVATAGNGGSAKQQQKQNLGHVPNTFGAADGAVSAGVAGAPAPPWPPPTSTGPPAPAQEPSASAALVAAERPSYPSFPDLVTWRGPDAHAILDAELDRLLDMLSGRGARSEVHARLVFDSFRSAVFNAVSLPRPNSTPSFSSLAAVMAEAHSAAEAEAQSLVSSGNTAVGAKQAAAGGGREMGAALDAASASTSVPLAVSERLLPYGNRPPDRRQPHPQPHLPLHLHRGHTQPRAPPAAANVPALAAAGAGAAAAQSQGLSAQAPVTPFPLTSVGPLSFGPPMQGCTVSPPGSLGSAESEVAAERLKAKTRAYLQKAAPGTGTATNSAANTDRESVPGTAVAESVSSILSSEATTPVPAPGGRRPPPLPQHPHSHQQKRYQHRQQQQADGKRSAQGAAAAGAAGVAATRPAEGPNSRVAATATAASAAPDGAAAAAPEAAGIGTGAPSSDGDAAAYFAAMISLEELLQQAQAELEMLQMRGSTGCGGAGSRGAVDIIGSGIPLQPAQEQEQQQQQEPAAPLSALEDILRQLQRLTRSTNGGAALAAVTAAASGGGSSAGGGPASSSGGGLFGSRDSAAWLPGRGTGSTLGGQEGVPLQPNVASHGGSSSAAGTGKGLEGTAAGERLPSSVGSVSFMPSTVVGSAASRTSLDASSPPSPWGSGGGYGSTDGGDRRRSYPKSPSRLRPSASIDLEPSPQAQAGPEAMRSAANANHPKPQRQYVSSGHAEDTGDGASGAGGGGPAFDFGAANTAAVAAADGGGGQGITSIAGAASDEEVYLDMAFQAALLRERMDAAQQQEQQHAWPRPRAFRPEGDAGPSPQPVPREQLPEDHEMRQEELFYQVQALKLAEMRQHQMMQQQQQQQQLGGGNPPSHDWQAALEAKLLPYDAARQHGPRASTSTLLDASAALEEWQGAPPPLPRGADRRKRGGGRGSSLAWQQPPPNRRRSSSTAVVATTTSVLDASSPAGGPLSRPVSPAVARRPAGAVVRQGHGRGISAGGGANAQSAPTTPVRCNSPAGRQHQQHTPPTESTPPNAGALVWSPLGGRSASRDGRPGNGGSILDRATPPSAGPPAGAGASGAAAAQSAQAPPARPPLPLPLEPIAISRPFAWQERETRNWLEDLGLVVTPAEESLPLLDNPLRNGLLLAALATRLAGTSLPIGVVTDPPRDVRSARTNILCALDHLGLLAASWAPPADAERRARAQAAAVEMAAMSHAIGSSKAGTTASASAGGSSAAASSAVTGTQATGGRSRSPSPTGRTAAAGPTTGSSGIIAIKALGSAGRGYTLRLKERQLRAGLGLVAEVESVLAGMSDSIWGLLNFIRLVCAPHYLRGAQGGSLAGGGSAVSASVALAGAYGSGIRRQPAGGGEEVSRRSFDVRGGPGVEGSTGLGPAPATATGGGDHSGGGTAGSGASAAVGRMTRGQGGWGGGGGNTRNANQQRHLQGSPARPAAGKAATMGAADKAVTPPAAAVAKGGSGEGGLRTGTPPRRLRPAMVGGGGGGGRGNAAGRARSATPVLATADPRGSPSIVLMAGQGNQHRQDGNGNGGAAGGGGSGAGSNSAAAADSGLLYRPLWQRLTALPYSPSELASLEQSLVRWLQQSGAISRREAAQGFCALLPMFEDGTFICWLVSNLSGHPIVGAHRRPLTESARRTNWIKAIEALRKLPAMSRRFLVYEEALIHCERAPLTGLLEDLHRLSAGLPPAPSTLQPNAKPYLPYNVPEPAVHMLPPDRIAVNKGVSPPQNGHTSSSQKATSSDGNPRPRSPRASPVLSRASQLMQPGAVKGRADGAGVAEMEGDGSVDVTVVGSGSCETKGSETLNAAKLKETSPAQGMRLDGGGTGPRQRPHSAIASGTVWSAAALGVKGEDSAGGGGEPSSGRRSLITDHMVTPFKGEGVVPPAGAPYRRRPSSTTPRDGVADGGAADPPHSARALEALLSQSLYPTHHIHLAANQCLGRNTVGVRGGGGSTGGNRSSGGVPDSRPQSPSPSPSPRLRLVPAAL